ncbi:CLUMA_CG011642, isoform A [Clunio marinus]|uniref:CLUMA_CG011642, isoform A n=1 Tax=Clunio marinus TaxID=568069 RepID=A0A1J1IDI8_9DIPT|nr:CLUMA_CG011642, isoform A [Clunio marinus]
MHEKGFSNSPTKSRIASLTSCCVLFLLTLKGFSVYLLSNAYSLAVKNETKENEKENLFTFFSPFRDFRLSQSMDKNACQTQ